MRRPGVIVGIAIAILAVTLWRLTQPSPDRTLRLTQLTFHTGLDTTPAISADGRFLAFASDRDSGNNLDLYVQEIQRSSPLRLTAGADDESDPSFSADASTIAFHSTKEGGGIYSIAAAGGEPRLLVAGGHAPRYSPDGRTLAFLKDNAVFLMPTTGGDTRRFHPELTTAAAPAWSPDSKSLLIAGHVVPVDDAPVHTIDVEDAAWTGDGIVFSRRTGLVRDLFRRSMDKSEVIERLTNGTESVDQPAACASGRIVFTSGHERFDVWAIPLKGGEPHRLTDTFAPTATPQISVDGRTLVYASSRDGFMQILRRDLASGKETVAATSAQGANYPVLMPNGALLYDRPSSVSNDLYLADRKLAAGTRAWAVDPKETVALVSGEGIDALDLRSAQRTPLLRAAARATVSHASFSHDGRWIVFASGDRIFVAPYRDGTPVSEIEWHFIAAGSHPRFSTGDDEVFFISNGAIHEIYFDAKIGAAKGASRQLFKPVKPGLSLSNVSAQAQALGVAREMLTVIFSERSSTIWMADPVRP